MVSLDFTPPNLLERIQAAGHLLATHSPETRPTLDALRRATAAPAGPRERLARLFVGALQARHEGAAADVGNLYGGVAGPAEMLSAFETFVQDTPLVRFAHQAANTAHLRAIGNAPAVCIVDIGLGLGSQWEPLLYALGRRMGGAPRVHLVGIDLPAPGPKPDAALQAVGARLASVADKAGVPFTFTAMPGRIEDLTLPTAVSGECLTINAAFALHHTGEADRDPTLRRLAATGADAIVLCEPEADHDAPAFPARLNAALHHYGLLFDVLDRCLAGQPTVRTVIEGQFFGREIHNVVVGEGAARVERHAPAADWSRRFQAVGLRPFPLRPLADAVRNLPEGVSVAEMGESCALLVDEQPLVVVSAWQ